jgi:hypothetical protein
MEITLEVKYFLCGFHWLLVLECLHTPATITSKNNDSLPLIHRLGYLTANEGTYLLGL